MRFSKRTRIGLVVFVFLLSIPCVASRRYFWLYLTRQQSVPGDRVLVEHPEKSTDAKRLLVEANRVAFLFNWSKAELLFARAEQLFRISGDTRNEAYARAGRIASQSPRVPLDDESALLEQQLLDPAIKEDSEIRLRCLAWKGYVDISRHPEAAKQDWMEARQIAHERGEAQWEARAEGELAIVKLIQGDVGDAATMAFDALMSAEASGDVGGQIRFSEFIGILLLEMNRYAESLWALNHAIKLSNSTSDAGFPFMAYEAKALALMSEGKQKEGKECMERALAAANAQGAIGLESQFLIKLGEVEVRNQNWDQAIEYLGRAANLGRAYKSKLLAGEAETELAKAYRGRGNMELAEQFASQAVQETRSGGNQIDVPAELTLLADIKAQRADFGGAEATYENAEDILEGQLATLHEPYWTSSLAGAVSGTYLAHFQLEAKTGNVDRALQVIESIRGRTAATILENRIVFTSNDSDKTRAVENALSDIQSRLIRSTDAAERNYLLEQLMATERSAEWAHKDEGVSSKEWFETPASLKSVQASLRDDEVLLEYVLSEPAAYCFWITNKDQGLERLSLGQRQIEALANRYLTTIAAKLDDPSLARQLYDVLIGPLIAHSKARRLIVVPDGVLHLLPFEILRPSDSSMVIQSAIVSYVLSSTVLSVLRNNTRSQSPKQSFLGVGDVLYDGQLAHSPTTSVPHSVLRMVADLSHFEFHDLPHSREEVLEASNSFGRDAVLLLGGDATEFNFKSKPLTDFAVIHLAVHGFVDPEFPERSALILGIDRSHKEDGLLQVPEITRLHFDADLVTLSACDSGTGKLHDEAGITSLAEAFLTSGARAVVASLWKVDDANTSALMKYFYHHLALGEDPALALRSAKLDWLAATGGQESPYYWASFILTGDGASPLRLAKPPGPGKPLLN